MSLNASRKKVQERRRRVWELSIEGYSSREIASKIEKEWRNSAVRSVDDLPETWDVQSVCQDISEELRKVKENVQDMAKKHLLIQVQRIEKMVHALWERAQKKKGSQAEIKAIKTINRLQKRKAKLLGLDEPERFEDVTDKDEDNSFKWPNPEDAPQLEHRKQNGEVQTNGTTSERED